MANDELLDEVDRVDFPVLYEEVSYRNATEKELEGLGASGRQRAMKTDKVLRQHPKRLLDSVTDTTASKFIRRAKDLPASVLKRIMDGQITLQDKAVVTTISANSSSALERIFGNTNDSEKEGIRNFSGQRIGAHSAFLVDRILIKASVGAADEDAAAVANFADLPAPAIINGSLTVSRNEKKLFNKLPLVVFDNRGTNEIEGLYRLQQPIMFFPNDKLDGEIKLAGTAAATTWIRLAFIGAGTDL